MAQSRHSQVTNPDSLHFSKFREFTGSPNSFIPDFVGQIICATDTNKIYRSVGTSAGNLVQITAGEITNSQNNTKILTEDKIWYVDATNGSDANDGLTVATAFKTLLLATQVAAGYQNPNIKKRTIKLLPGNHNGCLLTSFLSSHLDNDYIEISGETTSRSSVIVGGINGIQSWGTSAYYLDNLSIMGGKDTGHCIYACGSRIDLGSVTFLKAAQDHVRVEQHGTVVFWSNYEIADGADGSHIRLDSLSYAELGYGSTAGISLNISVLNPTFNRFIGLFKSSYLKSSNFKVTGTAFCQKFVAYGRSVIDTGSGNQNLFPGNQAGQLFESSLYF